MRIRILYTERGAEMEDVDKLIEQREELLRKIHDAPLWVNGSVVETTRKYRGRETPFYSHDISVVRHVSDRIAVMYLGRIVEIGTADAVVAHPSHPYTRALISSVPRHDLTKSERIVLTGDVPSPANPPPGCPFHPRCPYAIEACSKTRPQLTPVSGPGSPFAACIRLKDLPPTP